VNLDLALRINVDIYLYLIRESWFSASYMSADPSWCRREPPGIEHAQTCDLQSQFSFRISR